VIGRERVARFFSRIYSRPELSVVPIELVTGPALDIRVRTFRHVLTLEFDGDQIAAVRVQANPQKLSALG
jgi:RNA polymerase sigma-70 factor, ECF subfamily